MRAGAEVLSIALSNRRDRIIQSLFRCSYFDYSRLLLVNTVLLKKYGKALISSAVKMHDGTRSEKHVAPEFVILEKC